MSSESEFTEEEETTLEREMKEYEEEKAAGIIPDEEVKEPQEQKTLEGKEADPTLLMQSDTEKAERYQDILVGLGFKRFDNKEQGKGIACKLKTKELQIGRTFTEQEPLGHFWGICLEDCDFGKKGAFVKDEHLKAISIIQLFYRIRDGDLQIPEDHITGNIVNKSEKAIQVQFTEFNQIKTEWWGLGALKRNDQGETYIPAGFSKQTPKYEAKMEVPKDIYLPEYEEQLKNAPIIKANGHQPKGSDYEYVPEDVEAARHEKEQADRVREAEKEVFPGEVAAEEKAADNDERGKIIDDMAYFITQTKERLMLLFETDKMSQAEYNELLKTQAISAGIENGYRMRDRNRRY